jgi:two-component system, OmpR family, sensor histidine kinase SenX3
MNYGAEFWGAVITAFVVGAASVAMVGWTTIRTKEVQKKSQVVLDGITGPLNALASAGLVLDIDDKIVRATKSAFALGLVRDEELAHPKLTALVAKARSVKKPTKARGRDLALVSELGKTTLFVNARAIHLGEGYVLLLVEDRTESHNLEETRRDFVANISHELKTPIGAISLLAEAIQMALDDPAQVEKFAKNLETESQRLAHLVQDIIQLSHVQAKEVAGLTKIVDLNEVVAEAVDRNQVLAGNKSIEFEVRLAERAKVFGDDELLKAAVKNLIENAVIYSDEKTAVSITVRKRKGIAEIAVADKGPGISVEDQERIFERFYRVDPSRSRLTGGTGLGLSIVKHIAQKHLGEVQIKSRLGHGSTFTIRLPLAAKSIETSK